MVSITLTIPRSQHRSGQGQRRETFNFECSNFLCARNVKMAPLPLAAHGGDSTTSDSQSTSRSTAARL